MIKRIIVSAMFLIAVSQLSGQGYPWQRPLKMAWSADGISFNTSSVFQDSSGVPSVVKWRGDTLICAFQWFRAPMGSLSWDRVAVKFSYDNGTSWTQPVPIVVNGLPPNFQRPFDPTLVAINSDSLRIYFSSSNGIPMGGLDSTVNTFSAKSSDGINYFFEPNPRVDEAANRVIDPAVIWFNNSYHYLSPAGSPQQGAYHYVSPDGLNFTKVQDIPSDNVHNWTGNYMVNNTNELRFYGCGSSGLWYNQSANGGVWNGFVNTNIINGGDPSVVKTGANTYLVVYVGNQYRSGLSNEQEAGNTISLSPNPASDELIIHKTKNPAQEQVQIYNYAGICVFENLNFTGESISLSNLENGIYFLKYSDMKNYAVKKFVVIK